MFFIIIICPPLYLAIRQKWGAFVINLILMILAGFTILIGGIGLIFWVFAVGHAAWHYRQEQMEKHANLIAKKMRETEKK